ncbi:flagellar hook-basal body complex protein [Schaedlerella sp.]|uniref:flagellar hook-basal body complex protein n=1 Tax=Schaedlerella sp. TaxID=2676057 RepID=UPI003744C198
MVRSMIAGVAGLKAHQSKMDVIGNNIANVNTWGFKGYAYNFKDSMYTNTFNSSGGDVTAGAYGGRNASQVGYGSQVSSISNVFETGAPAPSSRPMDCMIDGTGFFLVGPMVNGSFTDIKSSGLSLSRVGIFSVDENGYLVDDQRSYVYGYALVDGTGIPETPATGASLTMRGVKPTITKGQNTGDPNTITIAGVTVETTYDENDMVKAVEDWVDKALTDAAFDGYTIEYNGFTQVTTDDTTTPPTTESRPSFTIKANGTGEATTEGVNDIMELFQGNNAPVGFEVRDKVDGKDYIAGIPAEFSEELSTIRIPIDPTTGQRYQLENYSISEDGTVIGVDEQKRVIALGQVALISVQNPNGLEKTDGYYYTIGDNAGEVTDVKPSTGPTGRILGGKLEMANVDLANEFSNIITTQRGFQANSKIITVTDEMLQELVSMKR